ncbi:MAG: hypothetical protein ACFFCZ_14885 [Promethearchaeota archaeon]
MGGVWTRSNLLASLSTTYLKREIAVIAVYLRPDNHQGLPNNRKIELKRGR